MQFLIDREQFFIRRAKFLVGGFELLDRRLQSLLGLLQLPLDLLYGSVLADRTRCAGHFVPGSDRTPIGEYDSVGNLLSFTDWLDCDADLLSAAVYLHGDAIARDPLSRFSRAIKGRPQISAQTRASHGDHVAIGRSRGGLQIFPGAR